MGIIIELNERVSSLDEVSEEVKDLALVLLDTALLSSGFHLEDPRFFSERMFRVMKSGLGLKSLDLADHVEIPKEEETDDDEDEEADEEELFDDDDEDSKDAKKEDAKKEEPAKKEPAKEAPAKEEPAKEEPK